MSDLVAAREKSALEALVHGPKFPEREFVRSGCSFAEVYAMAARFREILGSGKRAAPVCLGAEDRAVMAAALLASLGGGPEILLPYGFSVRALALMQQVTGFTTVLSDVDREFPSAVQVVRPDFERSSAPSVLSKPDLQAGLLRIFTGGSTGSPQIWAKTVENIFAEALFLTRRFSVTEQDCIIATIPPYHIYGFLFTIVLPLVSGAAVIAETPSFPGEIADSVQKYKGTILAAVPAHYRVLREKTINCSKSLRLAVSSAGMLGEAENQAFLSRNGVGVVEVYGSTETGGIATRNRSQGEGFFTPFPTVRWKIVDNRLAVCSAYISPDLPLDRDRFFITADRVEACDSGFLLKGRTDAVTKVGGKRVDLEDVRMRIRGQAGVGDCVVVGLPDPGGRGHLIAALIQGEAVDMDLIRKNLADQIEPYALPRIFKIVDLIPMQENGKYDRQAIEQFFSV